MPGNRGLTTGSKGKYEKLFVIEIGRTPAGSVSIHFRPAPPIRSFYGRERKVHAAVYALAAALEMALYETEHGWAVSPYAGENRLDLELLEGDDDQEAEAFVVEILRQMNF